MGRERGQVATTVSTDLTKLATGRRAAHVVRPLMRAHVQRYWPALLLGSVLAVLQVITKLAEHFDGEALARHMAGLFAGPTP
jgi:hypothetical protein